MNILSSKFQIPNSKHCLRAWGNLYRQFIHLSNGGRWSKILAPFHYSLLYFFTSHLFPPKKKGTHFLCRRRDFIPWIQVQAKALPPTTTSRWCRLPTPSCWSARGGTRRRRRRFSNTPPIWFRGRASRSNWWWAIIP